MITFVTSLYDLYNTKLVNKNYIDSARIYFAQNISIIVFTDEFYQPFLQEVAGDNVQVIKLSLTDIHIYNMLISNSHNLQLPHLRSQGKDTHEYLSLMNSKVELMMRAKQFTDSEYLAWLDIGCNKHFKDSTACFSRLNNYIGNLKNKVIIPGCYLRPLSFEDLTRQVYWIFLGTYFLCHRNFIENFYNKSLVSLLKFACKGYLIWEVNVWIDIMQHNPHFFYWYLANHDETYTNLPKI